MAAFISDLAAPAVVTSTNVPSSGLARRRLSEAVAIGCQNSLHTLGDMRRRQRRAGDVSDIAVDLERAAPGLADKLPEPAPAPDFPALGLPGLQDLDPVVGPPRPPCPPVT